MSLKELLGEDLYTQVMEKAGEQKIAVVSDGNWIPKEKFDELNDDKKELKNQLNQRDEQLEDLRKRAKDNEELHSKIKEIQDANEKTVADYEAKIQQQQKDFAIERALRDAKARNPKAVKALLDLENVKLDGDKLLGLDEQLKAIQESDKYLFGDENPYSLQGGPIPNVNTGNGIPTNSNPFSEDHFNMTEQGRLIRNDPDKARRLIIQAGDNPANFGL
ncbi:phage scaffolding protein [Bacillus licheniformis]|uniref:phage scaffolding protein n=1 Tax=Bacillus licheniformis TaxID=1402 RepID=UPI0005CE447F|nr:phage scaffolding protein [Bacillus licheniformis]KJE30047.1 phage minor structural GP20 family protein [Bacillus licheniformis]MEC1863129.1 phage scaffolding protein [Bacillus licheniformis]